jgi:hypothetical protein
VANILAVGGKADGVFDNKAAHEAAQTRAAIVLLPKSAGVTDYFFSAPPTKGASLTTIAQGGFTITGATPAELNLIDIDTGSLIANGVPYIDELGGSRIEIVSGTVRQQVAAAVSITAVGTLATVTKTTHGYSNGDRTITALAVETDYNGPFTISNVTANTYDYTMAGSPSSPATGTPTARKPSQWDFINDANHEPVGVDDSAPIIAVGASIPIPFTKTYTRVLGWSTGPDETLANTIQFDVGASVGLNQATLKASASLHGASQFFWDGAVFQIATNPSQDLNFIDDAAATGNNLIINHDYCPGIAVNVNPYNVGGSVNPFTPMIKSVANDSLVIAFQDPVTGLSHTSGSFTTQMAFTINKVFHSGLLLDGSGDSHTLDLSAGNIWFYGIFEI